MLLLNKHKGKKERKTHLPLSEIERQKGKGYDEGKGDAPGVFGRLKKGARIRGAGLQIIDPGREGFQRGRT